MQYSRQPGQYHRLLQTLEMFRDIGRMMITVEADYPDDFDCVLQVLFAGVYGGKNYEDIRQLRQMSRKDRLRFDRLAEGISDAETQIRPDKQPILTSPAETGPDESDEEKDYGGPSVTNYPLAIGRMIDVAIDGYQASRQSDVLKTMREVVNRLESLKGGDRLASAIEDVGEGAAVREALKEIVDWADEHRRLLDDEG